MLNAEREWGLLGEVYHHTTCTTWGCIKFLTSFWSGISFFREGSFYYNIEDNNGIERFQSFCKLIENELERYRGNGLLRERIICYLGIFYMDVYDYYVKVRKKIPFRTSLRKEQLIYDFCSLVAENFKNHKNVGFYADKLNITTTYLSAIMNERCGISAKEFLSIYIVLEVKSLLRDSRLNIQEIAILTNFPSQSTLNRFFRQRTGMTLSQYRKYIFQHDYVWFSYYFYNFKLLLQSLLSFICCINNRGDCLIDLK